jgi:hypothetical protein
MRTVLLESKDGSRVRVTASRTGLYSVSRRDCVLTRSIHEPKHTEATIQEVKSRDASEFGLLQLKRKGR